MSGPRTDIELMQLGDGELAEQERVDDALGDLTSEERTKLRALEQVSGVVRTHLELAADDADERLDALWGRIERGIAEAPAPAVGVPSAAANSKQSREPQVGWLQRFGRWLEAYRGHVLTGAVCAAAAAILVLATRSNPANPAANPGVATAPPGPTRTTAPPAPSALVKSEPPVVERLEVTNGSGTILTIPGEDGENPTTVIWLNPDNDLEGPL